MSAWDYPARDLDITTIPTGPDGKPDPTRYVALLQQLNAELTNTLAQARKDADEWRFGIKTRDFQIEALQQYQYKVLKRWLRRAAIIDERHERLLRFAAILAGILAVGVPAAVTLTALAWHVAVWAVAG